jgi:hypothetical protein
VYLRGARVPFVVRVAEGPVELLEGGIVRRRRDVDSGFGFLKCSIVGECLVNGFDKFVQRSFKRNGRNGMDELASEEILQ